MSADNSLIKEIRIPRYGSSILQCAVLGAWENLCGPCVKCRFSPATNSLLSLEEARSLVKISLSYHLKDPPKRNYFSVCDYGDLGLSGFNCVYTAAVNKEEVTYCFLGVFPRSYFQRLKSITDVFSIFWQKKMDIIKVYHYAIGTASEELFEHYALVINTFQDLLSQIEINHDSISRLPANGVWPIKFKDKFIQRSIASHLITFGRSLVIGSSTAAINHMIHILMLFSLPHRKDLCVFLDPNDQHRRYHSELFVQGLLWRPSEEKKYPISVWELLEGKYPLTIINVSKNEVHQSVSLLLHNKKRNAYLSNAILTYLDALSDKSADTVLDIFHFVEDLHVEDLMSDGSVISFEIEKLCVDLLKINNVVTQVNDAVCLFMRYIAAKAKALITYANASERKGDGFNTVPKRVLWTALNINVDGDYKIVLAFAEQLQPGVMDVVDQITNESHV